MPRSEPVTVLVVSELADEIKLVTLSLRGFFPNCRVEAVYSVDEALLWAPRAAWDLLLVDDHVTGQPSAPVLPELKRLAPSAVLVMLTDRSDTSAALNALQAGADFLLYKKSPAFLTELVLYAKQAVDTGTSRSQLEHIRERHHRLVDALTDIFYELDADGHFVQIGSAITPLTGYAPEELLGMPYTVIIPSDQQDRARYRFNDRRTGARASRRMAIELIVKSKPGEGVSKRVRAEVSAKGLYDTHRRYQGTVGLIRDSSRDKHHELALRELELRTRETDRILAVAQRLTVLSSNLHTPLKALLDQSQQLLGAMRQVQLEHQLDALMQQATDALRHGQELAQAAQETALAVDTLNDLLYEVLDRTTPPLAQSGQLEFRLAPNLPPFAGQREDTVQLIRLLILLTCRYLSTMNSPRRLRITTTAISATGRPLEPTPSLFPSARPAEVELAITETDQTAELTGALSEGSADLLDAYTIVNRLNGRLEFSAPAGGTLSIRCWLPAAPVETPPPAPPLQPEPPQPTLPPAETEPPAAPAPVVSESSLPDRRKTGRTSVHLPAKVTIGNLTREGTVTNISLRGTQLMVEGAVPSLDNHSAYVLCKTGVGNLELRATAHHRGLMSRQPGSATDTSLLALEFTDTGETEQKVLASFIEAAKERLVPFAIEALLALPAVDEMEQPPAAEPDRRGTDHREAVRVRMAIPVRIESSTVTLSDRTALGLAMNVSRHGACLVMKTAPGKPGDLLQLHFASTGSHGQPRSHEPAAPESILSAQIIWTAADRMIPADLRPSPSEPGQRIGVRFVRMTAFSEREINRVVAQHVGSSVDLEGITGKAPIVSARRECRNAREQVIAITDDHARHQISPNTPIVILAPGFGHTQSDYIGLSFFLAANRLRVLRYDHTNHVGQSDGDSLQTTLRNMQVDLQTVLEFAHTTWPTAPITILAEDVAARVAIKVAAQQQTARLLLLVNPVLDVHLSLATGYRHDILGDYQHGLRRGVANLWGLNVNLDQFLGDALAGDYADLATTVADLSTLPSPPVVLISPHKEAPRDSTYGPLDPCLRGLAVQPAVLPLPADLCLYSTALDDRHLAAFNLVLKQIAAAGEDEPSSLERREPALRDIHRQRQLEDERTRIRHHVSQATRDALWVAHLAQLPQLGALHDYWGLLEELYRWALPLDPGMTIVDLGCGQSDLARVIETNQTYRSAHRGGPPDTPLHYIGLDQTQESLKTAERCFHTFSREFGDAFAQRGPGAPVLNAEWVHTDWTTPLPLADGSVDRIMSNLSLSFLPSPLTAVRHALRVLRPHGILAVTCFQPHTDLSMLYRQHLRHRGQEEFGPSVQIVLHYLGRMREALRHGLLHSFERDRLAALLTHAGAKPLHILPLLNGQILLAVAQNGKSPG